MGYPASVVDALAATSRPDAAQVVVNALDLTGDLWPYGTEAQPANQEIIRTAGENEVSVIGIRAVAAGSLTAALDREVEPGHPAAVDFARAEPFRKLAAELGETPTALAPRGPLTAAELNAVTALR